VTFERTWSLKEIQGYVEQVRSLRRGCDKHCNAEECLFHLWEEIGELTREVRRQGTVQSLSNELADCLFYLAALATELKIDLGEALDIKEKINRLRFGA
jgi:NTP pyrophosphatase (non-canonical NTP hydrolase)